MSGESRIVQQLLQHFDQLSQDNPQLNRAYAQELLLTELLSQQRQRRSAADILHQVHYHLNNLEQDEFIVTRGC